MFQVTGQTADRVFAALADPARRHLLATLAEDSPKTATQLTAEFPKKITRQGITKHLDMLAAAGLVRARAKGREKHYTLAPEPLDEVAAWLQAIGARWDARLSKLKALVEEEE
jgi:DNA-binding transcriptional ArsR family regulator